MDTSNINQTLQKYLEMQNEQITKQVQEQVTKQVKEQVTNVTQPFLSSLKVLQTNIDQSHSNYVTNAESIKINSNNIAINTSKISNLATNFRENKDNISKIMNIELKALNNKIEGIENGPVMQSNGDTKIAVDSSGLFALSNDKGVVIKPNEDKFVTDIPIHANNGLHIKNNTTKVLSIDKSGIHADKILSLNGKVICLNEQCFDSNQFMMINELSKKLTVEKITKLVEFADTMA